MNIAQYNYDSIKKGETGLFILFKEDFNNLCKYLNVTGEFILPSIYYIDDNKLQEKRDFDKRILHYEDILGD